MVRASVGPSTAIGAGLCLAARHRDKWPSAISITWVRV